jgi:hypothetical protein
MTSRPTAINKLLKSYGEAGVIGQLDAKEQRMNY